MIPRELSGTDREFWASLALAHTPGLGCKLGKQLLDYYGSAQEAVNDFPQWRSLKIAEKNVADNFGQEKWLQSARIEWSRAKQEGMQVLTYCHPFYPERLRQIVDPPLYLYYRGDLSLLQAPCLAVVGSRNCSSAGTRITESISAQLSASGVGIVSGLAWGIDRVAHKGALSGAGGSLAVLGTGLDLVYPARNKDLWLEMIQKGLILTEFAPGTNPEAFNFPRRNRIISGLCLGVLVTEASGNSGSLITARYALEQNREVFAVPGFPLHQSFAGCNELIRQGAVLTRSAEDILREIEPQLSQFDLGPDEEGTDTEARSWQEDKTRELELTEEESDVVGSMEEGERTHIDTLTRRLGWTSSRTSTVLLSLELKGVVIKSEGMYYALSLGKR